MSGASILFLAVQPAYGNVDRDTLLRQAQLVQSAARAAISVGTIPSKSSYGGTSSRSAFLAATLNPASSQKIGLHNALLGGGSTGAYSSVLDTFA